MDEFINSQDLWDLCNERGWCDRCDNEQYERIFQFNHEGHGVKDLSLLIWICTSDVPLPEINTELGKLAKRQAIRLGELWTDVNFPDEDGYHAIWIEESSVSAHCSACGKAALIDYPGDYPELSKYCPNCGAKMHETI